MSLAKRQRDVRRMAAFKAKQERKYGNTIGE